METLEGAAELDESKAGSWDGVELLVGFFEELESFVFADELFVTAALEEPDLWFGETTPFDVPEMGPLWELIA